MDTDDDHGCEMTTPKELLVLPTYQRTGRALEVREFIGEVGVGTGYR